jgi:hypothetical protein
VWSVHVNAKSMRTSGVAVAIHHKENNYIPIKRGSSCVKGLSSVPLLRRSDTCFQVSQAGAKPLYRPRERNGGRVGERETASSREPPCRFLSALVRAGHNAKHMCAKLLNTFIRRRRRLRRPLKISSLPPVKHSRPHKSCRC